MSGGVEEGSMPPRIVQRRGCDAAVDNLEHRLSEAYKKLLPDLAATEAEMETSLHKKVTRFHWCVLCAINVSFYYLFVAM